MSKKHVKNNGSIPVLGSEKGVSVYGNSSTDLTMFSRLPTEILPLICYSAPDNLNLQRTFQQAKLVYPYGLPKSFYPRKKRSYELKNGLKSVNVKCFVDVRLLGISVCNIFDGTSVIEDIDPTFQRPGIRYCLEYKSDDVNLKWYKNSNSEWCCKPEYWSGHESNHGWIKVWYKYGDCVEEL